jgi:hypothetical protein
VGCHEVVKYQVRVPAGIYSVALMMAENYFDQTGSRVFSVFIEDTQVVTDLDVLKEAGKNHAYQIHVPDIPVKDDVLDIHFTNWIDQPLLNGLIISQVSTGIDTKQSGRPQSFKVHQNYPNPFNPVTAIDYELPVESRVSIIIFDCLGQMIKISELGYKNAGTHRENINLNLASGIYFYKLFAVSAHSSYSDVKKMMILK